MFVIVDYHKGNLLSAARGLERAGADVLVSDRREDVLAARAIVLPGVGSFADAVCTLNELELMDAISARVKEGVPFLGICLGLHLMYDKGIEGSSLERGAGVDLCEGLGFLRGTVLRIPVQDASGARYKVPHVGWNSLDFYEARDSKTELLFSGLPNHSYFYFTHSYMAPMAESLPYLLATTVHSCEFPSAICVGANAFGVQFHPEKSSDAGAFVLRNFVSFAERGGCR